MEASVVLKCLEGGLGPVVLAPSHLKDRGRKVELFLKQKGGFEDAVVFATSGTSSVKAKWVILKKEAIEVSAKAVNAHLMMRKEDRLLNCLPEFHIGGFSMYVRAVLAGCRISSFDQKWNPVHFTRSSRLLGVTVTSLVPTQIYDLVKASCESPESVRAVVVGGGSVSDELLSSAEALGWPVLRSYGMTETCSQIATSAIGEEVALPEILPIWKWRVASSGVFEVCGDALFSGYVIEEGTMLDRRDSFYLERPFIDGWFSTKDIVNIHDAKICSVKRVDEQVKVLGELVDLLEIELFLNKGLLRQEIVVVAKDDKRKGKILIPVMEDDSLSQRCLAWNENCLGFMRLESPLIIGSLPRTALGKIRRIEVLNKL